MTEITLFRFENKTVRTALVHGDAVWIAKDVADNLEYVWSGSRTIKHVPEEWRGVTSVPTPSGDQEMAYLTEAGLFFFLNRSDKPKALPFQKWVAGEVIPSIRKTGSYNAAQAIDLNDPAFLRQTLLGYTEKVIALEAEAAALRPQAAALEDLANQNGRHNLRSAAQQAGWPEQLFISRAVTERWLYVHSASGRKLAFADKIKAGLMDVKNVSIKRSSGFSENVGQPLFTQKGLVKFRELIGPYNPPRAVEAA